MQFTPGNPFRLALDKENGGPSTVRNFDVTTMKSQFFFSTIIYRACFEWRAVEVERNCLVRVRWILHAVKAKVVTHVHNVVDLGKYIISF